jgi:hypothetical protein
MNVLARLARSLVFDIFGAQFIRDVASTRTLIAQPHRELLMPESTPSNPMPPEGRGVY